MDACLGLEESSFCEFLSSAGHCDDGVCVPSECGDETVTGLEVCDGETNDTCLSEGFDRGRLACSASCSADVSGCSSIGWEALDVVLQDRVLTSVWVSQSGVLFAGYVEYPSWDPKEFVGGVIRVGSGATDIFEIANEPVLDVWGRSETEVYAVGGSGGVTSFDGTQWTNIGTPTWKPLSVVFGNDDVLVVATDDEIYAFDGTSWTQERAAEGVYESTAVASHAGDLYFLAAEPDSTVFLRRDSSSEKWEPSTPPPFPANQVDPVNPESPVRLVSTGDELIAVYGNEVMARGADPTIWQDVSPPRSKTSLFVGAWVADSGALYAADSTGSLYHRRSGAWTALTGPSDNIGGGAALALGGSGESPILVLDSGIVRSHGSHWSFPDSGPASFALWAAGRELIVSAGAGPSDIHAGAFQLSALLGDDLLVCGAWGRTVDDALVVGLDQARRLTAGGWSNTALPPPLASASPCPMWADSDRYWVGGPMGQVFTYDDVAWTPFPLPTTANVISMSGSGDVPYVLAQDGDATTLWRLVDAAWEEVYSAVGLRAVWVGADDQVHLVGDTVLHGTHTSLRPLAIPSGILGAIIKVHGTANDDVFAITDRGELLHFDGQKWSPIRGGLGGASTLFATQSDVFVGLANEIVALSRLQPW